MTKKSNIWKDIFSFSVTFKNWASFSIRNSLKVFVYVFLFLWIIFVIVSIFFPTKEGFKKDGKDIGGYDLNKHIKDNSGNFTNSSDSNDNFRDKVITTSFDALKKLWNAIKTHQYDNKRALTEAQTEIVVKNDTIIGIVQDIQDTANDMISNIDEFDPITIYDIENLTNTSSTLLIKTIYTELKDIKLVLTAIINSSALDSINSINESLTDLNVFNFYDQIPESYDTDLEVYTSKIKNFKAYIKDILSAKLAAIQTNITKYIPNPIPDEISSELSSIYDQLINIQNNIQNIQIYITNLNKYDLDGKFTEFKKIVQNISSDQKYLNDVLSQHKRDVYENGSVSADIKARAKNELMN